LVGNKQAVYEVGRSACGRETRKKVAELSMRQNGPGTQSSCGSQRRACEVG
jgi:hypothetical protein